MAISTGKSTKPSDGLRAKFPRYNYDDMVDAQYRLVTEHLGVRHLRLVLGNSMGGMQTWIWAQKHPEFMDIAVPMASLPTEMSGRNWIMRRLIIDSIRNDPEWIMKKAVHEVINDKIRESKLDSFLISKNSNVRYVTGFTGEFGFVAFGKKKPVLFTNPLYLEHARSSLSGRSWRNLLFRLRPDSRE